MTTRVCQQKDFRLRAIFIYPPLDIRNLDMYKKGKWHEALKNSIQLTVSHEGDFLLKGKRPFMAISFR
jgi:hypothetical protein